MQGEAFFETFNVSDGFQTFSDSGYISGFGLKVYISLPVVEKGRENTGNQLRQ